MASMLQPLREHKIYAKFCISEFFQSQIQCLGHVVSKEGILVDPEKVKAIMEWPAPKNVAEVRSFIGLAGYCRRFIRNFSKMGHPIRALHRKGKKFLWTDEFICLPMHWSFKLLTHKKNLWYAWTRARKGWAVSSCERGRSFVLNLENEMRMRKIM